jgi:hypothetical protein
MAEPSSIIQHGAVSCNQFGINQFGIPTNFEKLDLMFRAFYPFRPDLRCFMLV